MGKGQACRPPRGVPLTCRSRDPRGRQQARCINGTAHGWFHGRDSIPGHGSDYKPPAMPTVLRFIQPCLPSPADRPPSGSNWIHEIKHDGYRLMARRDSVGIRLITRRGNDWSGPGSRYRSGRSPDWLKFKNPEAPAAKREAEEEWGR
jgi:hypothetical protein